MRALLISVAAGLTALVGCGGNDVTPEEEVGAVSFVEVKHGEVIDGITFPTLVTCDGSKTRAAGWIIVDYEPVPPDECPSYVPVEAYVYTMVDYRFAPIGFIMSVDIRELTPPDWVTVDTYYDPNRCQSRDRPSVDPPPPNVKTIKRVE